MKFVAETSNVWVNSDKSLVWCVEQTFYTRITENGKSLIISKSFFIITLLGDDSFNILAKISWKSQRRIKLSKRVVKAVYTVTLILHQIASWIVNMMHMLFLVTSDLRCH